MSASPIPGTRRCQACFGAVPVGNGFCGSCGAPMPVTENAHGDALIGRVIDNRYRVLKKLGQGGMGAVFLAEHVGIGKRMAIKVLRADLRGNPEIVRRFRREAMAVSRLTDAHTITVFDFGLWKGLVYLVMEYLPGMDLGAVIDEAGRLQVLRALSISYQVCSSLAEAHAVGIVHRDLKPENVFLARTAGGDELVKVLDFGLAKMVAGQTLFDGIEPSVETQDGAILGTPFFMAPEQVRGLAVDARTDIYALGALIFRMLTGRYPFEGRTSMQVLEGHLSGRLPSFAEIVPNASIPSECEQLVRRMMARRVDDRPASALAIAETLARLTDPAQSQSLHTSSTPVQLGALPLAQSDTPWTADFTASSASVRSAPVEGGDVMEPSAEPLGRAPRHWAPHSVDVEPPTRDEFSRYERRLRWRRRMRWLVLLLLTAGAGLWGWHTLRQEQPTETETEIEPNDEPAMATAIREGKAIRGHLGRRARPEHSDWDIFRLPVPPARPYVEIDVSGVPGIDIVLEGHDSNGIKLFQANAQGVGAGERLYPTRVEAQRLLVLVREVWVKGQRPVENTTDAYALTVRFLDAPTRPAGSSSRARPQTPALSDVVDTASRAETDNGPAPRP